MSARTYSIREMTRSDVDIAIDWAEAEGWNPGIHDAECFYATDPHGFFIGLLGDEAVGTISAVAYGESFGFMGFYIVKPEFRNRTYGTQLVQTGMEYLGRRCIGLDSVRPDLVSHNWPQFKAVYTNRRYRWTKDETGTVASDVVELSHVPFTRLLAYDTEVFGFSRETFLQCWITRPGSRCLGLVNDDKLTGYGVIRPCREGYKIGPLFADKRECAHLLFAALTSAIVDGRNIYLDTPEGNPQAEDIVQRYGMTEVFKTTRMYNQQAPSFPIEKWFGVTSYELG